MSDIFSLTTGETMLVDRAPLLHISDLVKYIYYTHGKRMVLRDVLVRVWGDLDPQDEETWSRLLVSNLRGRIKYLQERYLRFATLKGGVYTFQPRACIQSISPRLVVMRDRTELIRKLMADVMFSRETLSLDPLTPIAVSIPRSWIRSWDLPVFSLIAPAVGIRLHPKHAEQAQQIIDKHPLKDAVRVTHSVERRYYLRYYVATGQLSLERFRYHRKKMLRDRMFDEQWDVI